MELRLHRKEILPVVETGESITKLSTAGTRGHSTEAGTTPVDGAVREQQPRRRLGLRQSHRTGSRQLGPRRHHDHVLATRAGGPHAPPALRHVATYTSACSDAASARTRTVGLRASAARSLLSCGRGTRSRARPALTASTSITLPAPLAPNSCFTASWTCCWTNSSGRSECALKSFRSHHLFIDHVCSIGSITLFL